jgi:hypothetical protein
MISKIKDFLSSKGVRSFAVAGIAFLTIAGTAAAATTIGSNIDTDGTLTVDGNATFDGDVLPANISDESLGSSTAEWNAVFVDTGFGSSSGIQIGQNQEFNIGKDAFQMLTFTTGETASGATIDDAMYTFSADNNNNTMTADQEIFEIGKGDSNDGNANFNELFSIDEDGDVAIVGALDVSGASASDDDEILFDDGTERLFWDDAGGQFEFTDDVLFQDGFISQDDILVQGQLRMQADRIKRDTSAGNGASVTGQGNDLIFEDIYEISTSAAGADVTLASLGTEVGVQVTIINSSGNAIDIFPSSGGEINDAGTDASISLSGNSEARCTGFAADSWSCVTLSQ